ncbi:hypothetical protein CYMTET_27653 [Cymbomonas tetramitiformis]|uniref:Uncharacterized protein n=1 Tax=Cymbomonas tetramitiformis TaxID=36881 RepID=A0AAE0FPS3_9CHLO|nr:hypothetical protein CYMTET_34840 [Cymbomonas tetramitiformis]KAK3263547.1 hypothetical protein CYMTET_27653 [Cymbomonas tetramitiformis]
MAASASEGLLRRRVKTPGDIFGARVAHKVYYGTIVKRDKPRGDPPEPCMTVKYDDGQRLWFPNSTLQKWLQPVGDNTVDDADSGSESDELSDTIDEEASVAGESDEDEVAVGTHRKNDALPNLTWDASYERGEYRWATSIHQGNTYVYTEYGDNKMVRFLSSKHGSPDGNPGSNKDRWDSDTRKYVSIFLPQVKLDYDAGSVVGLDVSVVLWCQALLSSKFKSKGSC